jgi:hypothetical protein
MEPVIDIEDFDLQPGEYRVYATSYDSEGAEIEELLLGADLDPEEAIRLAKFKTAEFRALISDGVNKWEGKEVSLIVVRVETVIICEEEEQFVGSLYEEGILAESNKKYS